MKNLSLSLRLVLIFTLTATVIWGIAGFVSYKETRETIDEFFDTYQMALGRQLAAADWQGSSLDMQQTINKLIDNMKYADEDDEALGFAVFTFDGKRVFHDNLNGKNFKFVKEVGKFSNEHIRNENDKWRIMRFSSVDGRFIIAVGQELEYREDLALDIVEEFLSPWLIGFLVLLLLIAGLTFWEFRPLKRLARKIEERAADDFSPVEAADAPAEIKPLLKAMNQMLEKIGEMINRERSFISDSAHELRTPLTALKIQLELLEMAGDDTNLKEDAIKKLGLGLERSEHLVEQLLALSRIEANTAHYDNEELLEWEKIIQNVCSDYKDMAEAKQIKLKTSFEGSAPYDKGNGILTALMIRNLIDNAIKYSPINAKVNVILQDRTLIVRNSLTVVDETIINRLSERFFRPAGQKENGSGLGLAIVERIVGIYNCVIYFQNTDSGFQVTVGPK